MKFKISMISLINKKCTNKGALIEILFSNSLTLGYWIWKHWNVKKKTFFSDFGNNVIDFENIRNEKFIILESFQAI